MTITAKKLINQINEFRTAKGLKPVTGAGTSKTALTIIRDKLAAEAAPAAAPAKAPAAAKAAAKKTNPGFSAAAVLKEFGIDPKRGRKLLRTHKVARNAEAIRKFFKSRK